MHAKACASENVLKVKLEVLTLMNRMTFHHPTLAADSFPAIWRHSIKTY